MVPSRALRLVLLAIALFAVVALAWSWRTREGIEAAVAPEIRGVLARDSVSARRGGAERREAMARVLDFYQRRDHRPAWLDGDRPDARALDLLRGLTRLAAEGLDPAAYGAAELAERLKTMGEFQVAPNPARLADADVALTAAYLRAADDLRDGRLPRRALDPDWVKPRRDTLDLAVALHRALVRRRVAASLEELAPSDAAYRGLRQALVTYRDLEQRGGWRPLGFGRALLRKGDDGEEVDSLRARLATEVPVAAEGSPHVFDAALERALKTYQRRRGLKPDGVFAAGTRAVLDVPVSERLRAIEMSLERRRWLPRERPEPYLEVNIPDFTLEVIENGRRALGMRVVVGATDKPTPVFTDEIAWIEVNPTWRIPRGIVANEIVPAYIRDRDYFWKNHLHILWTQGDDMPEVPPEVVHWADADSLTFPFIVFQEAGPTNPLGRIKFMCPNEHDVYLHDTPAKGLFSAGARDQSHGCVRIEQPMKLAAYALRDTSTGHRDSLQALVDSTAWRRLRLKQKLPVHLMYWTAWVDSAGGVQFRDDVYGLDQRLSEAFREGTLASFEINPKLEKVDERIEAKPKKRRVSLWSRMRLF